VLRISQREPLQACRRRASLCGFGQIQPALAGAKRRHRLICGGTSPFRGASVRKNFRGAGWKARPSGMTLLEVLMAVSLLGISFVSIFSGLSAALRATGRLDLFDRGNEFAIQKLNELFLDPSLQADDHRSGVSPSGIEWEARTELVEKRPLPGSETPAQLVRIDLQVFWSTRKGRQTLNLETLKLVIPEPPPGP
jgi:prepilin-type N-terminal cleavage/methylation domain-containing protein